MSIIVKEKIDPHAVILDTNILFDQDKSKVVNPEFDKFWENYAAEANLQLVIPEVVIGELLFQQTTSALKTLSRANDSFDRLSTFTGNGYSHRVSESRVKKEIRSRLYAWAKTKKFYELATPVHEMDWG
jgi:predicted nucleic acid-binding protein